METRRASRPAVVCDFARKRDQLFNLQAHEGFLAFRYQQFARSLGVSPHARRHGFELFDASDGKLDQGFDEVCRGATFAGGVPHDFPGLVSFPVVTVVEEVDAAKIGSAGAPVFRFEGCERRGAMAETVAGGVGDGMGSFSGDVGVRRKGLVGK